MKFCSMIPPTNYRLQFSILTNRANTCAWFWGFLRAWWRGEKEFRVDMWCTERTKVYDNGVLKYPLDDRLS